MKKGISSILIIIAVVLLAGAGLGFAFKSEIIYQTSPKLYLTDAMNNTSKKIENTKGVKELGETTKDLFNNSKELSKNSTKTDIYLEDYTLLKSLVGNIEPSIHIIDNVNNKFAALKVNMSNKEFFGVYLGEDNSLININNNKYNIENKTFVKDYNSWLDKNKTFFESMGITSFSRMPDDYQEDISYTNFRKSMDEVYEAYDEQVIEVYQKQFKDLLSKGEFVKGKSDEPNTKQIIVTIKEEDAKKFIEDMNSFYGQNQSVDLTGDLKTIFVTEKNLIKNVTFYNTNNENNKIRVGVKSIDDYLKDMYITLIQDSLETEIINTTFNQINKDLIDITFNLNNDGVVTAVNTLIDFSKTEDNIKFTVGNSAGTLIGGNIEATGSFHSTKDEFLFSVNKFKMGGQSDINVGFVLKTTKDVQNETMLKSDVNFFDTKFEIIGNNILTAIQSLGL